jgi:hypothetical protein
MQDRSRNDYLDETYKFIELDEKKSWFLAHWAREGTGFSSMLYTE